MTGVWMSDSSGFAVTPPRADSDVTRARPVDAPERETGTYERTAGRESRTANPEPGTPNPEPRTPNREAPNRETQIPSADAESELMIARGEDDRDRESDTGEPRIERYRER
jgi:hypothetical protein